jgi:hypothetical protein
MRLHDIATARAGDKGNTSQIAVIAKDAAAYELIREKLTTDVVVEVFAGIAKGPVRATKHRDCWPSCSSWKTRWAEASRSRSPAIRMARACRA